MASLRLTPSTVTTVSVFCKIRLSRLNGPTPHDCYVRFAAPSVTTQDSLGGRLCYRLTPAGLSKSASFAWRTVTTFAPYHEPAPAGTVGRPIRDWPGS